MGEFYWETIPEFEFNGIIDTLFINLKDVKISNEVELSEYMCKETMIRDPMELPQWRLILKENYQKGKSLMILKMHHTMTDGYGVISLLSNMTDESQE